MGYEVKLIIGKVGQTRSNSVTGGFQTFFQIQAEVNLNVIGDGPLYKSLKKNIDPLREYYWYGYDGNKSVRKDPYGDRPELITIDDCINALKENIIHEDHRQFHWALALLESMKGAEFHVLWYAD